MSVWLTIPSARPVAEVNVRMDKWRKQGYRIALWRDFPSSRQPECDILRSSNDYPGYARTVNALAKTVFRNDPNCDWIVAAGDDTDPDMNVPADEIAAELSGHFTVIDIPIAKRQPTFGVMQPTGDRWADSLGVIIERIAGSPWLGREWCRRANAGKGPLWPEFRHMFVDEHLQRYAQSLGVFWQRPDLIHFHDHAQRDQVSPAPPHMAKWNTPRHWVESKAIFDRLVAGNFQDCAPIA